MGLGNLLLGGGAAVGIGVMGRCGFHGSENLSALPVVRPGHSDFQKRVGIQQFGNLTARQHLLHGVFVVQKTDVQRIRQFLTVGVVSGDRQHPVKPVDVKLQGRIDVHADSSCRGKKQRKGDGADRQKQKAGGHGQHIAVAAAPGPFFLLPLGLQVFPGLAD